MMHTTIRRSVHTIAAAAVFAAGCDRAQLVAPIESSITIQAGARVLPPNGSTSITAVVLEQAGTPVQNGTTVRFVATVGYVDPVEAQTHNGVATTTYFAGTSSGVARLRAVSGAASGGETGTNQIEITVGTAAVNAVTLRANPGSVGPNGGTVELIANVVAESGEALQGIAVTFSTDQGTLNPAQAITDANGDARTQLTTTQQAVVTATAGTKTSPSVTVAVRSGPIVTIACTPASGTGNCAAVPANVTTNTATVVFTVTRSATSSTLRSAVIDFGDGTSQDLGNLAGGTATVTHSYAGPSDATPLQFTATVRAVDVNGESASVSTSVIVTRPTTSPINVSITDTCATATTSGQRCTFTATATGGGEGTANAPIQSYTWDFGDDSSDITTSGNSTAHVYTANGEYTVTVTVRTADGRTATGRTEVLVKLP